MHASRERRRRDTNLSSIGIGEAVTRSPLPQLIGWRNATREFDVLLLALTVWAFLTSVSTMRLGTPKKQGRAEARPCH
jgi:hypothetical protein